MPRDGCYPGGYNVRRSTEKEIQAPRIPGGSVPPGGLPRDRCGLRLNGVLHPWAHLAARPGRIMHLGGTRERVPVQPKRPPQQVQRKEGRPSGVTRTGPPLGPAAGGCTSERHGRLLQHQAPAAEGVRVRGAGAGLPRCTAPPRGGECADARSCQPTPVTQENPPEKDLTSGECEEILFLKN